MSNELARTAAPLSAVEELVIMGDLAKLSAPQRLEYYTKVCESVGLNPYTRPFDYITLNNKLTLYARKDATDQLRKLNGVSIVNLERETVDGVYIVVAHATMPDGRSDEDTGAVNVKGLSGEALANAMMKAITKAKRRVTLSICGLGWLDETEVDSIPDAKHVTVADTGEIVTTQRVEMKADPITGVVHQPANGNGLDADKVRKRFMAVGSKNFGSDWDGARRWMLHRYTTKRTPDNVREHTAGMTAAQLAEIADTIEKFNGKLLEQYQAHMREEALLAEKVAAELNTMIADNPFDEPATIPA